MTHKKKPTASRSEVRALRLASGVIRPLPQSELARRVGVNQSTISRLERGEIRMSDERLKTLKQFVAQSTALREQLDPDVLEQIDLEKPTEVLRAERDIASEAAHDLVAELEVGAAGDERKVLMGVLRLAVERVEQLVRVLELRARKPS